MLLDLDGSATRSANRGYSRESIRKKNKKKTIFITCERFVRIASELWLALFSPERAIRNKGVQFRNPETICESMSGHLFDTLGTPFSHSGAGGPKGPGETLWDPRADNPIFADTLSDTLQDASGRKTLLAGQGFPTQKWLKSDSWHPTPEWLTSVSKVTPGIPPQSDSKVTQKWLKSDSKVTQKWLKNGVRSHFWVNFGSLCPSHFWVTFGSL